MANKTLTASAAIATSGNNCRVRQVTIGATDAGSVLLRVGGAAGSIVWGGYSPAGQSVQLKVPGIVADYATLSGTTPYATIEFDLGR